MKSLKHYFFILGLVLLIGCENTKSDRQESGTERTTDQEDQSKSRGPQKTIIVYGSMECNHCHEFRRKLESKGIIYEFRDVDKNDAYYMEMQKLILSINYNGYVRYPVIDIEGEVFVNPDFGDVETKMFSSLE